MVAHSQIRPGATNIANVRSRHTAASIRSMFMPRNIGADAGHGKDQNVVQFTDCPRREQFVVVMRGAV